VTPSIAASEAHGQHDAIAVDAARGGGDDKFGMQPRRSFIVFVSGLSSV
jgi:hypothetical protein